ncbi:unnamed protein product [Rotaria sp. Silwood1]|nr:unnamed protein product [Rotaria sp. Silwood1]CAF1057511.1 unnamed protein product [Rotaria sp. Silwood1]
MSDKSASQGHWEAHSHAAKSTKIGDNPATVTGKEASAEGTFDDVVEVDSVVDFVANVVNIGVVGVDAVADVVEVDSVVHVDNVVSVADIVRVDSVADVVDVDSVIDVDDVDSVVDVVDIDSVIDSVIDPILDAINDYVVNSDSVIGAIADIVSVACVVDVDGFNDVLVTTSDGTVFELTETNSFNSNGTMGSQHLWPVITTFVTATPTAMTAAIVEITAANEAVLKSIRIKIAGA